MAETLDTNGLHRFAEQLVQGSIDTVRAAHTNTRAAFVTAYGEGPNSNQAEALERLFPWFSDRYDIGPYGVTVVVNEDYQRSLGLGEFITEVATACGVEPSTKEVETVIYHIGNLMGKLKQ
jgi:hypothetical protein